MAATAAPCGREEKRATFNGPIWSVLGTWTSTLSGKAFNEMRAYYGVNKIRITSNLAGTSGLDLLQQNARRESSPSARIQARRSARPRPAGWKGETNFYLNDSLTRGHGQASAQSGRTARTREVPDGHRRVAEGPMGVSGRRRVQPGRSQQPPRHVQRGDRHGDARGSEVELRALRAGHLAGHATTSR